MDSREARGFFSKPRTAIVFGAGLALALGLSVLKFPLLQTFGVLFALGLTTYLVIFWPELCLIGYLVITSTLIDANALPKVSIGVGRVLMTDLILLAMIGYILVRTLWTHQNKIVHSPLSLPLLLFFVIGILSTLVAIGGSTLTLNESLGEARRIFGYATFFVTLNLIREKDQILLLERALYLLAALVGLAMIIQFTLGSSLPILPGRVESLWTEGMSFAEVTRIIPPGYPLVTIGFILMTTVFINKAFHGIRVLVLIQWALMGIGVALTFKRHLWAMIVLAALAALLLVSPSKRARSLSIGLAGVLFILVLALTLPMAGSNSRAAQLADGIINRVGSLFSSASYDQFSSLRWRDFEYQYAVPQIVNHPFLGLGLGATYRPLVPHRDHAGFDGRRFIHNGHIYVMVKTGLLGYLFYLTFALLFLIRGFRGWRSIPDPSLQPFALGCTLAFLAIFLGSIIEPMIVEWHCTALIGLLAGINETILICHGKPQLEGPGHAPS